MYKQSPLPGFPDGAQKIGAWLSILEKDGAVTYFLGGDNYFSHPSGDKKSQRFALTRLMENGHVRAPDLEKPAPEYSPSHADELESAISGRRSDFVFS